MMTGHLATLSKYRLLARLAIVAAIALCTAPAYADTASEARARYERAVRLYEDGVYDAALVEFTRAYELNPSFKVLYNLGQTRVAMQDYAGAIETFQQYLREGAGQIQEARAESVRQELARLEERVARLNIQSDVSGAEVLVDDTLVGTIPLRGAVLVNSGVRRVTVRDGEHAPQTQRVSVAGGETRTVSFNFTARPIPSPSASSTSAEPETLPPNSLVQPSIPAASESASESRAGRSAIKYAITGITAGLALTAGSLGIVALVKNGDLEDRRDRPGENRSAFDDDRHRLHRMAIAADVLGLAAIAGIGVSTWLWLRRPEQPTTARRRVGITLAGTSVQLSGEF